MTYRVVFVLALLLVPSAVWAELPTPQPAASAAAPLVPPPAPPAPQRPPAEPVRGSPFAVRLAAELPLTLGAGVLALTTELVKSELPGLACGTACDPGGINALDSLGLGSHSSGARTASDLLVGVNVGLPLVIDFLDVLVSHPPDGWRGYGADVVVLAEVLAVNAALNGLVKNASAARGRWSTTPIWPPCRPPIAWPPTPRCRSTRSTARPRSRWPRPTATYSCAATRAPG